MRPSRPVRILKIGGSVITDRTQDHPRIRRSALQGIASEIAGAYRSGGFQLVLIHGAGSFGHPIVKRTGIDHGIRNDLHRLAFGETQRLQTVLNSVVVGCLLREALPAFPFQASANAVLEKGQIKFFRMEPLWGLLGSGMIPVLYGVPACDVAQGCSILSGDHLASYLAPALQAEQVLHGTNVKGVYTTDPFLDPDARFVPQIDLRGQEALPPGIGGSSVTDVTGGMRKKLEELKRTGTMCQVFDATVQGNVRRALSGEVVGTTVICG